MASSAKNLLDAYEQLEASLISFTSQLPAATCSTTLFVDDQLNTPLHAAEHVAKIWYERSGDGRRTDNLYGFIAVKPSLIPLVHQLNQHKQTFQQAVTQFRKDQGEPGPLLFKLFQDKRDSTLHRLLSHTGNARLNLRQSYRQVPVLDSTPQKIRFSWYSNGRSMTRMSVQEAEARLLKMDLSQMHIQMQLEALARIPQSESLVRIQPQAPVMRANIFWRQDEQYLQKARNCPLPIIFPLEDEQPIPEYNRPPETPPEARSRQFRSDLQIEPEPYLPSLRVHRYKHGRATK